MTRRSQAQAALRACAYVGQMGEGVPASPELCVRLLHDTRLYCREGIRDERVVMGVDCGSRRLEFERRCQSWPPRGADGRGVEDTGSVWPRGQHGAGEWRERTDVR